MSRKFLDNCIYSVNRMFSYPRGLSFNTRRDYIFGVKQMIRELHEGGYQVSNINHLKPRHADYLIKRWQDRGISAATIKNRLAQIRFIGKAIKKPMLLPKSNDALNIGRRIYVGKVSKALNDIDIDKFSDPFIRYSVRLQQHFGLRREESIKFIASHADTGYYIQLSASWTKGGVERDIPITTPEQRALIDEIKIFVKRGCSLIPTGKTYANQRDLYMAQVYKSGYQNLHRLRHAYAQRRYLALANELTGGKGWPCPHAGGKSPKEMPPEERAIDRQVRLLISNELGHSREDITSIYLGN